MQYTMCVFATWWSCVLISRCWKGWCIGPIELTACEILKENLHDAASHWHLTSCHLASSWLPTYFSASALAVEVLPLACSKKRVKFEIRAESAESFARVLHSVWCHYDNFFTWLEITAVFWSEIRCINRIELCNHPFKRYRRWRSRAWTLKKLSRQIISSTQCDSCSGGVVLFYSKFQESEDRQMVPFVESYWILF